MNSLQVLKKLQKINKSYYTPSDLAKITGLYGAALKVRILRLKKAGIIESAGRGIYTVAGSKTDPEKTANDAVYPSYLSFAPALSKYGVISEVPYGLEFATTKTTRRKTIAGIDVLYRKLKKELFFGYTMVNGVLIAEPEKAFLDILYMSVTGKERGFDPRGADIQKLNKKKIREFSKKFPQRVRNAAIKM